MVIVFSDYMLNKVCKCTCIYTYIYLGVVVHSVYAYFAHHELALRHSLFGYGVKHLGFMASLLGYLASLSGQLPVLGGALLCINHL